MFTIQYHSLARMTAVWLLPIVVAEWRRPVELCSFRTLSLGGVYCTDPLLCALGFSLPLAMSVLVILRTVPIVFSIGANPEIRSILE
jgi:hypothetical protein